MIIDCHTRLWSDARQLGPETAESLSHGAQKNWEEKSGDASAHGRAMSCIDAFLVKKTSLMLRVELGTWQWRFIAQMCVL